MIKNIVFDLSEVIISGYHGTEQLIDKKYGISAKEFKKRKEEIIEVFLETMRGNISEEDYWKELLRGTSWKITIEDLKATIRQNLNQPVKGTMKLIKQLQEKYQLILLSDHVKEWMEYIKEKNQGIKIFDKIVLSYEIGSLKSDKSTFIEVVKQTKIVPDETIFIDDYEINVKRAEEQGIHGIVFQNVGQLKEELKTKYQILV